MRSITLALLVAACGRTAVAPLPGVGGAGAPPPGEVVATVAGRPITVDQVKLQAESAQTSARVALDALIDAELVAREAERRGLQTSPEAIEATHQAMVRRLLATTFEAEVTPATLPEAELRQAYERNRFRLDHPVLVEVQHIVARAEKQDDAARRAVLRRRAEEVAARARGIHDVAQFIALGPALSDDSVKLRVEEIHTARRGYGYSPAFCDGAFAIAHEGEASGVVETEFGYHVIFLVRRIPEEHHPFEEAMPHLREGLWPDYQRREFMRYVTERSERHLVQLFPDRLSDERTTR